MAHSDLSAPEAQPQWYVSVGGQVFGPADKATLAQWSRDGRLPPHAQIAPAGSQTWSPLAAVPELRDLVSPGRSIHTGAPLPPTVDRIASCPHCGGPVTNETPAYGMFFGVFEKSILPRLRCAQCRASLRIEQLPEPYRSRILQTRNRTLAVWIVIVIPLTGVLVYAALRMFGP